MFSLFTFAVVHQFNYDFRNTRTLGFYCFSISNNVGFLSNQYWFRSILAIAFGIFIGMVGVNPDNNEPRLGAQYWFFLEDGIQIMHVAAGLFAIPELTKGLFLKHYNC